MLGGVVARGQFLVRCLVGRRASSCSESVEPGGSASQTVGNGGEVEVQTAAMKAAVSHRGEAVRAGLGAREAALDGGTDAADQLVAVCQSGSRDRNARSIAGAKAPSPSPPPSTADDPPAPAASAHQPLDRCPVEQPGDPLQPRVATKFRLLERTAGDKRTRCEGGYAILVGVSDRHFPSQTTLCPIYASYSLPPKDRIDGYRQDRGRAAHRGTPC